MNRENNWFLWQIENWYKGHKIDNEINLKAETIKVLCNPETKNNILLNNKDVIFLEDGTFKIRNFIFKEKNMSPCMKVVENFN